MTKALDNPQLWVLGVTRLSRQDKTLSISLAIRRRFLQEGLVSVLALAL